MESTVNLKVQRVETALTNWDMSSHSDLYPVVNKKKDSLGISINKIALGDIQIIHFENLSPDTASFEIPQMTHSIIFHFQFSEKGETIINGEKIKFRSNEQSFYSTGAEKASLNLDSGAESIVIQVKENFVLKYFKEMEFRWATIFPHRKNQVFSFHKHQLPVTPPMRDCIDEMFQSKRQGLFLKLHLESLLIRLMMLQFEQMENHDCEVFCSLKRSEANKIYKAKKVIAENLSRWFTISELSVIVGTNACSLKRGFKEVFGSTVFEFIQNHKMQEAHRMLYDTEMNISSISDRVGYKNVTHFSAAFKRKFGLPPSEIKPKKMNVLKT